jgi:hypothetical protein
VNYTVVVGGLGTQRGALEETGMVLSFRRRGVVIG